MFTKVLNYFKKEKVEKKVEFIPNPKDVIVIRSFLSDKYSDITSSVYCHYALDPDGEINAFVKISDCSKMVTIHSNYCDTKESFTNRIKVLRNCLSEYLELLNNV